MLIVVICCAGLQHPITCVLASLSPQDVQSVLSLMSQCVPRTLEALLMHTLPPVAAELLTQKLEQADGQGAATGTRSAGPLRVFLFPFPGCCL